jgi:hypothetical protein
VLSPLIILTFLTIFKPASISACTSFALIKSFLPLLSLKRGIAISFSLFPFRSEFAKLVFIVGTLWLYGELALNKVQLDKTIHSFQVCLVVSADISINVSLLLLILCIKAALDV